MESRSTYSTEKIKTWNIWRFKFPFIYLKHLFIWNDFISHFWKRRFMNNNKYWKTSKKHKRGYVARCAPVRNATHNKWTKLQTELQAHLFHRILLDVILLDVILLDVILLDVNSLQTKEEPTGNTTQMQTLVLALVLSSYSTLVY